MINNRFCCWVWKFLGDEELIIVSRRSFNCGGVSSVGSDNITPHIIFDYIITSHQFNPTPYFTKQLSDDRIKTQDKVRELHKQGLGYTKIHQYLIKNGYKVGKSRTTVDSMIKKMKRRDEFLSQPILDGIGNFRIKMMEYK
jgi:hypothetical protein